MRVIPSVVKAQAVVIDQALPDSSAGRDAAVEIRAGLFTGLSVEVQSGHTIVLGWYPANQHRRCHAHGRGCNRGFSPLIQARRSRYAPRGEGEKDYGVESLAGRMQ